MPLHLTKCAVGCDSIDALRNGEQRWIVTRDDGQRAYRHRTRYMPKRAAEIEAGGSLYWIIKSQLVARQRVLGFEVVGEGPAAHTLVHLDITIAPLLPTPRKFHQGWRYMSDEDAPDDLADSGAGAEALPPALLQELRTLGLM